jgi:hypothetical protein
MMKTAIGISTKVFDLAGHVLLYGVDENASTLREYRRRLTRTATLDSGAYIDDRGYYPGDRTIDLSFSGNQSLFESLLYIIQNYSSLWITLPDGAYSGNMQTLNMDRGRIRLTLLLEAEA